MSAFGIRPGKAGPLGKEIDDLGTLIGGIGSGQKVDSKLKKRMGARLKSMAGKVG